MTGAKPKELEDLLEIPEEFAECWQWFLRLNNRRTSTGFGVNPIGYTDILALFQLLQYQPLPWEVDMIERFDVIAMEEYDKQIKKNQAAKESPKKKVQSK